MAANFWENNWARCLASKQRVLDSQIEDRARGLTEDQIVQLKVHFSACIGDLVRQYKTAFRIELRQRVAATATVYFRRFYLKNCFCLSDPRLVYVGCVYLAAKAEESVLPAKHLVSFMRKHRPGWTYEMRHLLEVEMVLLEDLNFDLIIFSPYRSLTLYLRDADLGGEVGLRSWTVLNDSYRTDVSLLHPPHLVALACLQLACMHIVQEQQLSDAQQRQQNQMSIQQSHSPMTVKLKSWTETLIANVDMERVFDIVTDITAMYERYGSPISIEECNRLLDCVQGLQTGVQQPSSASIGAQQAGNNFMLRY